MDNVIDNKIILNFIEITFQFGNSIVQDRELYQILVKRYPDWFDELDKMADIIIAITNENR